jgi:hypothetical protein
LPDEVCHHLNNHILTAKINILTANIKRFQNLLQTYQLSNSFPVFAMHISTINLSFGFVALLLPSSLAVSIGRRGPGENVMLANCQDANNNWSAEMAYYSGPVAGNEPDAIAVIPSDPSQVFVWESTDTIYGTFPDGDVFSSQIPYLVNGGTYAGIGTNNKGPPFACYKAATDSASFYESGGNTCTEQYICDHSTPIAGYNIDFMLSGNTAQIVGSVSPNDVLGLVENVITATSCTTDAQPIPETDCTVSFTCHGDAPQTNKHLADALMQIVGTQPGFSSIASQSITPQCLRYTGISGGPVCIEEGPDTQIVTTMLKSVTMNLSNQPTPDIPSGSDAGQMTYTISCPSSDACLSCHVLEDTFMAGALIPGLEIAFGAANVFTTAQCQSAGC